MNDDALIYSRHCELQKFDANHFLEKYANLIEWTDKASILDIGCAEGTVSLESLVPKIPPNFQKLTLVDFSPNLLNFARERISDSRIECLDMDITDAIPVKLQDNFDHIFSFYCLNAIDEKRTPQTMRNIFELLKPGGGILMLVMVTSPLYVIFTNMMMKGKMPSDMFGFQKIISPYHGCESPDGKLRFFLENTGFEVPLCQYEQRTYTYDSWEKFLGFAFSIVPFSKIASEAERKQFTENFVMETKQLNLIQIEKDNYIEKIHMSYSVVVAFASRPSRIN